MLVARYTEDVYFVACIAFCFGAIVGSFLNVVVLRLNSGRTLSGRSQCFSCGRALQPIDLFPIISYVFLRGRCRSCGSRISLQYPLVELITALLFLGVYLRGGGVIEMAFLFIVMSFFVAIGAYDVRHKIIPDTLVYPLIAITFIYAGFNSYRMESYDPILTALVSALIMAVPLYLLWRFSKGRAMGLGDGKLALALGALLTPAEALSSFVFAFWGGALIGILMLIIARTSLRIGTTALTMKSEIPFAPFLIVATVVVILFGAHLPFVDTYFHAL